MAGRTIRVGVIGTGVGRLHIEEYGKLPGVKVVAACDLNAAELKEQADRFGIPLRFSDYRRLLEVDELDAVSIAVPNHLHEPMTRAALARGLHVLCEKPMATSAAAAQAMVRAARRARRRLMIHMSLRFSPNFATLKKVAASGKLGEIYCISGGMIRRRSLPATRARQSGVMARGDWCITRAQAGGGALFDLGVHEFDLLWWVMGNPVPRSVLGSAFQKLGPALLAKEGKKIDVEEMAVAQVNFEGGRTIQFAVSWAANMRAGHFVNVYGTKAGVSGFPLLLHRQRGAEQVDEPIASLKTKTSAQAHFIACVRDPQREMIASGEECLTVARVLDAVRQSAATGRAVALPDTAL